MISDFTTGRAIGMLECGKSFSHVARKLRVSRQIVARWWTQFLQSETVVKRTSSGRSPKTSRRSNRLLVRIVRGNRLVSSTSLLRLWNERVSRWTVRRRLNEAGFSQFRCPIKPLLSEANREARYRWAQNHVFWTEERFRKVVWTDESRFRLFVNDGRLRLWRHRGETLDITQARLQGGGGSVHVWASIWHDGRSSLQVLGSNVSGEYYCVVLTNFRDGNRLPTGAWKLQHDNAPAHRAHVVQDFLRNHNISVLPWPSRSPDLNPIEHAWDYLGRRVRQHNPTTLIQLTRLLIEEWERIPQDYLNTLIDSVRKRIGAVLESKGGPTKY